MEIVENVHVEIRTKKHMTKVQLAEKDINTINDMIYILKELYALDPDGVVRDYLEKSDLVPNICYSEFVDWLKACKEILSLGIVWDEDTDEILTMVPGNVVELSY